MAATKRKKKSSKKITWKEIIIALIVFILGILFGDEVKEQNGGGSLLTGGLTDGKPAIHFVDVGQADCTLITYNGDAVLIDAGTVSAGDTAAEYVRGYADAIDYFVITHPHEDHSRHRWYRLYRFKSLP